MNAFIDKRDCDSDCENEFCIRKILAETLSEVSDLPTFDFSKSCMGYQKTLKSKWQPADSPFSFNSTGDVFEQNSGDKVINSGLTRKTAQSAGWSASRVVKTNRLSALAHELGGEVGGDLIFKGLNSGWYVIFVDGKAISEKSPGVIHIEKVYMTESCADAICEMINSGHVVL